MTLELISGNSAQTFSATSAVLSREPSSTTITSAESFSASIKAKICLSGALKRSSSSYAGMIIEIAGIIEQKLDVKFLRSKSKSVSYINRFFSKTSQRLITLRIFQMHSSNCLRKKTADLGFEIWDCGFVFES